MRLQKYAVGSRRLSEPLNLLAHDDNLIARVTQGLHEPRVTLLLRRILTLKGGQAALKI
jgi:hypothetical protein